MGAGSADLLAVESPGRFVVIEVKLAGSQRAVVLRRRVSGHSNDRLSGSRQMRMMFDSIPYGLRVAVADDSSEFR